MNLKSHYSRTIHSYELYIHSPFLTSTAACSTLHLPHHQIIDFFRLSSRHLAKTLMRWLKGRCQELKIITKYICTTYMELFTRLKRALNDVYSYQVQTLNLAFDLIRLLYTCILLCASFQDIDGSIS